MDVPGNSVIDLRNQHVFKIIKKKIITYIFCPASLTPSFPEAGERKKFSTFVPKYSLRTALLELGLESEIANKRI